MSEVSSHDQNPVVVDEVGPVFLVAILGGFWLLIAALGYLALG